jgi:hypothetical protein
MDYTCFEPHTIYVNGGNQTKDITVSIVDKCGGKTSIYVIDPNGTHVFDKELSSPGQVTLSVDPGHEVHVFCNGGNDQQSMCGITVDAG